MAPKTLDVEKAVNREHHEPKLRGKKRVIHGSHRTEGPGVSNRRPFEIRLKKRAGGEDIALTLASIDLGMTPDEVIEVAGKPSAIDDWYTGNLRFNYGNVWIVIEKGVVTCLVHGEYYRKYWSRNDYEASAPEAIFK